MTDVEHVDFLVIGSGGGGLTAALVAAAAGRNVLVAEKLATVGGSTALSGGMLWIPNNPVMREAGQFDSFEEAWAYLDGVVGDAGPATSDARKRAYLELGPHMVSFLRGQGVDLVFAEGYPDYYSARRGGRPGGRSIEGAVFDGKRLGEAYKSLNRRPPALMPFLALRAVDLRGLSNGVRTWADIRTDLGVAWRSAWGLVRGHAPLTMGASLVAQLVFALQRHGVDVRTQSPLVRLVSDDAGAVVGAVVTGPAGQVEIRARDGVMLAAGGFSRDAEMRAEYQPVATTEWTSANPGDEGDGVKAGVEAGAAVALMDEAWWMPSTVPPGGMPTLTPFERAKPGSIIVDTRG